MSKISFKDYFALEEWSEKIKSKKPGFFANLFGGPKFKRRKGKGIDGF